MFGRLGGGELIIILNVAFLFTFFNFVQRWLSNINITAFNQLRHLTIEEG